MNQAIHTIDLLIWMFGEPEVVHGLTAINRAEVMETEDAAVAVLRFPNNVLCTLSASTSAFPGFKEQISVYGPKGSCTVEAGKMTSWETVDKLPMPIIPQFEPGTDGLSSKLTLFQRQYRNILAAIGGKEPLLVTAEDAISTLTTARALYGEACEIAFRAT